MADLRMTTTVGLLLVLLGGMRSARAGDWPQILGPNRNGIAAAEAELKPWPSGGPARRWAVEVGAGFAGPAVVGDRVVVFHRVGPVERAECLERRSGKSQWQADFPATYPGGVNPDNGPRCVPLIDGERVFLFGAAGNVHCVALADGQKIWSREAYVDYAGQEGYFGAGTTPILVAGKLLVNVGGRDAGIVAFDAQSGKTMWRAGDDRASYSSPTTVVVDGKTYAVFVTRLRCVAVEPETGAVLFHFPFGMTGPTVNAATPLVLDKNTLFLSASYGIGAKMVRLEKTPSELWATDDSMSSQYTTCVHRGGYLYGVHGREDYRNGELRCIEAATGKIRWQMPGFGVAHPILVGEQLLMLTTEGELVLAAASPDRYDERARARVSQQITRSLPALSNGELFFRDNSERGGGTLSCWALR